MRRLERHEFDTATDVLARAFDADPMFRALLPDEATRGPWLRFIMASSLAQLAPDAHVFTTDEGVRGVIGVSPPGRWPPPAWRWLPWLAAFWRRPRMPWPTARLRKGGLALRSATERLHPRQPHYYVYFLGVDPDHQGRGHGRALLAPTCALADRDHLPAYLETTNPKNLGLYRRFGFEVVDEVTCYPGAPPLWTMLRPGR